MTETEKQILKLVSSLKPEKAIESIERVGKYLRQENSIRINGKQYGRIVDERWDELNMKNERNSH